MQNKSVEIVFGALSPSTAEQVKSQGLKIFEFNAEVLQLDADAITHLAVRRILPDAVVRQARQRLVKRIGNVYK